MYDDRIDYKDQTDWTTIDRQGLWSYLNRLFQSLGPSDDAKPRSDSLSAQIQARRTGKRDDRDRRSRSSRLPDDTRYLMRRMLIHTER